jgi:Glycoside Hydrolase Family 113
MELEQMRSTWRAAIAALAALAICLESFANNVSNTDLIALENMRAVHMGGNWGVTRGDREYLDPVKAIGYIDWLHSINANWVGVSVALRVEDSMDSSVERAYTGWGQGVVETFTDDELSTLIGTLKTHGFRVFLTLAFEHKEADDPDKYLNRGMLGRPDGLSFGTTVTPENWPWAIDHPDHDEFVAAFFQSYTEQAVHFGILAESLGVDMYSLGTETEGLFRTRASAFWTDDFNTELNAMVADVRDVYSGLVTYNADYGTIGANKAYFGDALRWLWSDLDLDVVGLSAYFELVDETPATTVPLAVMENSFRTIYEEQIIPLAVDHPGKPIVFTEFGYVNSVRSPQTARSDEGTPRVFSDVDQSGFDDGDETQRNAYLAHFNVSNEYQSLVAGEFLWGHEWASDEAWHNLWGNIRTFSTRDKLAETAVQIGYVSPPGTPRVLRVSPGVGEVTIVVAVDDNGLSPVLQYQATCSAGAETHTGYSSAPSVLVTGLTNNVTYNCTTQAINAIGAGPVSKLPISVTPDANSLSKLVALENMRAVHMGGNWGVTRGDREYLDPVKAIGYIDWLHSINANWVGVSVALRVEDSMDSSVERAYTGWGQGVVETFTDDELSTLIGTLKTHGFRVFLTLAFEHKEADDPDKYLNRGMLGRPDGLSFGTTVTPENWPWAIDHPDHDEFVAAFFQSYTEQAVHFGILAESLGVDMYSLGTETEGLFRTRASAFWTDDFNTELNAMVADVRDVYSGLVTYNADYGTIGANKAYFGDALRWLWSDLDLDVVGLSAYFELVDETPATTVPLAVMENSFRTIYEEQIIPLAVDHPGKPIVFTEFGYVNSVRSPQTARSDEGTPRVFSDVDQSGFDDGDETQRNAYLAHFNVSNEYQSLVAGEFLWGHDWAGDEAWHNLWGNIRTFSTRDKLAESAVQIGYVSPPGTPRVLRVSPGVGEVTIVVAVDDDGLSPVLQYQATCSAGAETHTGYSSAPSVLVTGLTSNVTYNCTTQATNAFGAGLVSKLPISVTPEFIGTGLPSWLLLKAIEDAQ